MALIITLILLGIILLLVELLLIPGFGVAGVLGIAALAGGVAAAYYTRGATTGHIVLLCAMLFCGLLAWGALRSGTWRRIALHEDITARAIETAEDRGLSAGMQGVTVTRLAPMGIVKFGTIETEATAYEGIINPSQPVEIVKTDGTKVIVKRISNETNNLL
jgi:membrane-bound ClpP family serine protease